MPRFFRIVFNTLTVLSLVLAVGIAGLWGRSYWRFDLAGHYGERLGQSSYRNLYFQSANGNFRVGRFIGHASPRDYARFEWHSGNADAVVYGRELHVSRFNNSFGEGFYIEFPHWYYATLFALLPTYSTIAFIRQRERRLPAHCPSCGYDLRATPDRCPECGAVPKGATV